MPEFVRRELRTGEVVVQKTTDALLDELGEMYRKRAAALVQLETYLISYPDDEALVIQMMTLEALLR